MNHNEDLALIELVSKIVSDKTGVILGERQRQMVQGRIARRIRECGLTTPQEYHTYLRSNLESETPALVSLLTTHHTFFFREYEHFDHLLAKTLPKAFEAMRASGRKKLRILSAACSKGHEVYSLAMFLKKNMPVGLDFEIVGGDVDTESVAFAKNGVYRWEEVKTIPATYLQGNWARGTGAIADFVKVSESIRSKCSFEVMNLAQMPPAAAEKFDVVFCRNVFIYFEKDLVKSSVLGLLSRLHSHGDLIIGLSESLNGLDLPVAWEGPSVYKHKGAEVPVAAPAARAGKTATAPSARPALAPLAQAAPAVAAPIKVFAVDDSPTVLKLLEKMAKEVGFEFLGSAKDGEEALRILTGPNAPKPNVITLDLHMPKMNGLEFLKAFRKVSQTPVIVVSSINREETALAQQALAAGAGDYVEKPAMDRWKETTAELVSKIRVLAKSSPATAGASGTTDIDKGFARANNPGSDRRWILVTKEADRARALAFASANKTRIDMVVISGATKEEYTGGVKVVPASAAGQKIMGSGDKRCFLVFGEVDEASKSLIGRYDAARVLFEEVSGAFLAKTQLRSKLGAAVDVCPATSFAYEADRIVAKAPAAKTTTATAPAKAVRKAS